jgi:competence protein ComEC
MIIIALGFVYGAWLLQQQSVLPALHTSWILAPSLIIFIKFQHKIVKKFSLIVFATLCGFFWAATFSTIRLSDELPKIWEQ